jgi:hypothetical protein
MDRRVPAENSQGDNLTQEAMMSTNDPWLKWNWDVFAVDGPGAPYEKPPGTTVGHFTLGAAVDPVTQAPCYVVLPAGLVMPACWSNPPVYFFPRGSVSPLPVVNKLPVWSSDPTVDAQWLDAANALRAQLSKDVQHLEGAMSPEGKPETIFLFCVENAVVDATPLLALHLDPGAGFVGVLEDGTGHGGGHD